MKLRLALVVLGSVAVVAGLAWYFTTAPGMLARDYRDQARPEHAKLRTAVRRMDVTLVVETFGAEQPRRRRIRDLDRYLRSLRRDVRRARRKLGRAQRAIRQASTELRSIDEDALLDVPAWPGLEGRGNLEQAEDLAAIERRYLARARVALREYRRLVSYTLVEIATAHRVARAVAVGFDRVPDNPTAPEQVAGPLERTASRLDRERRRFRRRRPPASERRDHRIQLQLVRFYAREIRALARAFRRRDLAAIRGFDGRMEAAVRRHDRRTRGSLDELIDDSRPARLFRSLRALDRRLDTGYDDL